MHFCPQKREGYFFNNSAYKGKHAPQASNNWTKTMCCIVDLNCCGMPPPPSVAASTAGGAAHQPRKLPPREGKGREASHSVGVGGRRAKGRRMLWLEEEKLPPLGHKKVGCFGRRRKKVQNQPRSSTLPPPLSSPRRPHAGKKEKTANPNSWRGREAKKRYFPRSVVGGGFPASFPPFPPHGDA